MLLGEWDIMPPDILVSQDGVNVHWYNRSLIETVTSYSDSDRLSNDSNGHSMWNDTSWTRLLSKAWNEGLAQRIHDEIWSKFGDRLLPMPTGSVSFEPFRFSVLCKGLAMTKEIESFIQQKVREFNERNGEKEGFHPVRMHTFGEISHTFSHSLGVCRVWPCVRVRVRWSI